MISVRRTLLSVLSVWHGLAAFKNVCDLAAAFGVVPAAARWRSHNLAAMEKLLLPLRLPRPALGTLLAGAAVVEAAALVAALLPVLRLALMQPATLVKIFANER